MPETAQERTEQATPKRRQDARKKGTVAKSQDLTNAISIVVLTMALPPIVSNLGHAFMLSFQRSLSELPTESSPATIGAHVVTSLRGPVTAFVPLVALIMCVGLASNFAQVGFVLSGEALTPSFNKINPLNGIKRLFSISASVEGLKATLKSALFGYLAYSAIQSHWDQLVNLAGGTPTSAMMTVGDIVHQILLKVSIAWLVLAALDYYFQRKQIDKQLKMTKEEVKQEMKEMEQSPELRMAIAKKRRSLTRGRMMQAVQTADVIVTNPTHFSVAIKYDSKKMHAPQVVAKGQDLIALRIREIAAEHRVPIVPNPPLARQLYKKCEIGDFVPREMFQAVAEVLAYVYKTIKNVR